jgi:tRNA A37 threonylcarbamoyladenosine dehydratase
MTEQFSRIEVLIGSEAMDILKNAKVAVFGVGGVGGYAVEALARSGVGKFDLIDNDTVSVSNLNRQIIATVDTIGKPKVEVMRDRILSINPKAEVTIRQEFFLPEKKEEYKFSEFAYVVDAVDTVTAKIALIQFSKEAGVPVISSMGTGNKMNPMELEVTDISKTSVCPLAKVMRKELKDRGIKDVKVVYSKEQPIVPKVALEEVDPVAKRRGTPGSTAFVPSVAGLIIASEVIKDLTKEVRA